MALRILYLFVFISLCSLTAPDPARTASGNDGMYTVKDIAWHQEGETWVYTIKGSTVPTYTRYELFSPHRLRLDIAEGAIADGVVLPMKLDQGPVGMIMGKSFQDKEIEISRLELLLQKDVEYVVRDQGSDILVAMSPPKKGVKKREKAGQDKGGKPFIADISMLDQPEGLLVKVDAGAPIYSCEATEVAGNGENPPHLLLDLEGVGTEKTVDQGPEKALVSQIKAEPFMSGSRLQLDASGGKLFDYELLTSENGLHVKILPPGSEKKELLSAITDGTVTKKRVTDRQPKEIAPRIKKTKQEQERKRPSEAAYLEDQFSSAGYSGEKITVDFYQSNLHNVFRLIGEVSGRNIIVAEGVSGTLTLSLKDVPWDFMLDIILNLKNLNKEEQFNTIIISPASKKFEWPGQDQKEDLVINRPATVSRETEESRGRMEAAKLLRRAKGAEKADNYQEALSLYEEVFNLDSSRGDIAARITSLTLTKLGLNAKAAHYGRIACRLKPDDNHLALLTATALAKTGKPREAVKYYDQAVSGPQPSGQALAAYAAFSEEYKSYRMALDLWNKYENHYGASLETMVSRARISDLLGERQKAADIYRRIKMSGYEIPRDLSNYIDHRLKH